jgi:hypothetical protein
VEEATNPTIRPVSNVANGRCRNRRIQRLVVLRLVMDYFQWILRYILLQDVQVKIGRLLELLGKEVCKPPLVLLHWLRLLCLTVQPTLLEI